MIQRYFIQANDYQIRVDGELVGNVFWCKSEDVDELEDKYAKLEAKNKKLEEYFCQLYYAAADLTNPYIEREQEELKEQVKDTLRNFEKDPLFWEIIA